MEDRDGRVFSVPNAALLSSKIVNYSKSGYIEIPVDITLPLTIPFGRAQETILSVLTLQPEILPNILSSPSMVVTSIRSSYFFQGYAGKRAQQEQLKPRVLLTGISHVAMNLSIRFWIEDISRREDITSEVLAEIGKLLVLPHQPQK